MNPRCRLALLACALLACGVLGCQLDRPGEPIHAQQISSVAAPANDPSPTCTDLGVKRVCYSELCPGGICVLDRPWLPEMIARRGEYRCSGAGRARHCRLRRELASPFVCKRGRCVQSRPRLPDDNEWECTDVDGMVLCRGGTSPSGVLRVKEADGWWCGLRRGTRSERLCLDLDPDRPSELGARAACRFEADGAQQVRICETEAPKRVGEPCGSELECPSGARCARGLCVPPTLRPVCWSDADCKPEQCRLASCGDGNE